MRRLTLLVLAGLTACGGGGGDPAPVTPPPAPTIALSLAPSAGTAARGATTTTSVTVARGGGYAGTVTLGADAVPSGVTVTFTPSTLTGSATSATATITVGATATAGTSNLNISATGSGVSASSAAFALTVPTPAISLAATSATASVTQGTAGNIGLTITRTNGFADAVSLAATGMPTGVTATFAPASIAAGATTSTLVLAVANNAATGSYPITITASGTGVANVTTAVTLTVTAAATPAFSLSASPAALSVTAGQNGTSTITAARTGGFAGDVALAVSGAPAGMTATLTPASLAANVTTASLAVTTTTATAPGAYTLTVNGTGTGVSAQNTAITVTVAAPPGVTISTIAAQQLSQGTASAAAIPLVLTRTGGLAGDLTMSLEGAPSGVTATFAPNPATASSTQMTLNVSSAAVPGSYTLTVRATGAGGVSGTTSFALTVTAAATGSFVINAVPATLSVAQGQTGLSTINIARAGGFTGAVTLTATGLPAGTTATFTPSVPTGTQSQLGLDVGTGTAAGTYTITIRGQGAGVSDATTTLSLTVTPGGGGGGSGNVNWTFCDNEDFPLWFAVQQGSGAWNRVTSTGTTTRVYNFSMSGNGAVAYAQNIGGGGVSVTVQYLSQAELEFGATAECVSNPAKKTLTGTVAGLSAGQTGTVMVGSGSGSASVNGPVTVTGVPTGTTDLFATRSAFNLSTFTLAPDRAILRRNVNFASVISPTLDFAGGDSFAMASAPYTFTNLNGEAVTATSLFLTANGTAGSVVSSLNSTANPATIYGVPSALTQAGDLHGVLAVAISGGSGQNSSSRGITQYNRELTARTIAFGPALTSPTLTSLGSSPYVRFSATGPWQAEYGNSIGVGYTKAVTGGNAWTLTVSRNYAGTSATTYSLVMPDFSGVAGFNTAWGLGAGTANVAITASGIVSGFSTTSGTWSEGGFFRFGSRTTTIAP